MQLLLLMLGLFALALSASAAEPARTVLIDKIMSLDENRHGVMLMLDWPVGSGVENHTHPGDEYAYVLEGAVEVDTQGQGRKIYRAGEAYHNEKGIVHSTHAADGKPAKTVATIIVNRGAPLSEPAQKNK